MKVSDHNPVLPHGVHAFLQAIFRFAGVSGASRPTPNDEPTTSLDVRSRKPPGRYGMFLAVIMLLAIAFGVIAMVFTDSPPRQNPTTYASWLPGHDHASAIIAIIAGYCAAETHAGRHLDPDVLRPYLDDHGPWWQQRRAALAIRRQQHQFHTPRLVSWQVRRIVVHGEHAEVDTLEVWENQERDMTAPAQAIVAATYQLHVSGGQWFIWNLSLTPVGSQPLPAD